jgi:hypothetical protein
MNGIACGDALFIFNKNGLNTDRDRQLDRLETKSESIGQKAKTKNDKNDNN